MSKFFINRPIVAMVISILMVIMGLVAMSGLPIAQFPNIADPQIQVNATYPGADATTIQQSVATPIEQQMSGVDNMEYMYSLNANNGTMKLTVDFNIKTDPNTDQILAQMRQSQAASQLPSAVNNQGVTVQKSTAAPLIMFALYSPSNTYDGVFLANYAVININDLMTRVPGIASVSVFGAGNYAMRLWVRPDRLAQMGITVPEIINAIQAQNAVNPAGQVGGEPIPRGQQYTYAVRAPGRLETSEQFENIVLRAAPGGSILRVKDVARVELGAQNYNMQARLNGRPSALIALYQLPDSNAVDAANGAKNIMEKLKRSFPPDLDYVVALDTTLAVTAGMKEIEHTLVEAIILVIIVVFIFLQGWRATLIPLLAVPVSLIGTFALFPLFGFSINTLSLFGLVLAIGLVVDDAIVVVEIVEHHIEKGLSPKDAALKGMQEVAGPVMAIAIILAAVFLPTAFIPGITGRLYQQFAVTIAVSVAISAFNALTLSPALAAMLLRPKVKGTGLLQKFYDVFNKWFGRATDGYVGTCRLLIHKSAFTLILLAAFAVLAGLMGKSIPTSFLPNEDQGYAFAGVQLPDASSAQRTSEVMRQVEEILRETPGVKYYSSVVGYSMLSGVQNTYSGFFFITLEDWDKRKKPDEQFRAIMMHLQTRMGAIPGALAFPFLPPAIPGVGASGGVTFILEDRTGQGGAFLADNLKNYLEAVNKRPELMRAFTTALPSVPQVKVNVDQELVLQQGVKLQDVYQTMQCFMGGAFVNYFNRFGRQWQVYVQAEGDYRTKAQNLGQFYVLNNSSNMVPLAALTSVKSTQGPEFTMRYNLHDAAQINASPKPGYSSAQAMKAMEEVFAETMPPGMGFDYMGMSYQEQKAQQGISPMLIFGFSLLCVFLILAAQYESWSLPFSVLLGTPVAVFGAFAAMMVGRYENNVYAQIGLVMLIGLSAKNAILIVEFAKMGYEEGKPLLDAALDGARLRLRPILMTSFAFILGCVPLATATGAGAVSRRVMGCTVIGGMLAASFIAIFLIPVIFYVIEKLGGEKHQTVKDAGAKPAETQEHLICKMKSKELIKQARKIAESYRITKGGKFRLKDHDPGDTMGFKSEEKPRAREALALGVSALAELQDVLYAQDKWAVLLIFQAMDAAGKDGAIKHVMSGVNPQGCQVHSFKSPSAEDLDHDYLWRAMKALPNRGSIGIFNRSYYEETLIVRVHPEFLQKQKLPPELVTKKIWRQRFDDICNFERYLANNGIAVCKFFLHVSRKEQKRRFLERLETAEKNWKFSAADLAERGFWDQYQDAYEDTIRNTAAGHAPWYVVPADNKWFTRVVVAAAVIDTLAALDLEYPKVDDEKLKELAAAKKALLKK